MELWLILAISAYFSYAISVSMDKYLMNQHYSPLSTNTVKMLFDGIFALIVGSFFFSTDFSTEIILPALLLGTLYAASGVLYFSLLKRNKVNEVVPSWQALTPLLAFLGAALFLSETPNRHNYLGMALISGGMYAVLRKRTKTPRNMLYFVILIAAIDSTYGILAKYFLGEFKPVTIAVSMYFATTIILAIGTFVRKEQKTLFVRQNLNILPSAFFGSMGTLLLFAALSKGDASQVYPIGGLLSVFVLMFAALFLNEKFSAKKLAGTLAIFAGIYLVSV